MIHNAQTVKTALYILLIYIYSVLRITRFGVIRRYTYSYTYVIYRYNADFICTKHTFYKRSIVNYG